jgi:hypothetical protein
VRIIKVKNCAECPYLDTLAPMGTWCDKIGHYIDDINTSKKISVLCPLPKLNKEDKN